MFDETKQNSAEASYLQPKRSLSKIVALTNGAARIQREEGLEENSRPGPLAFELPLWRLLLVRRFLEQNI